MSNPIMWRGWISGSEDDRPFLTGIIGAKVGPYNYLTQTYETCELTPEAFDRLHEHWGKFYWGLDAHDKPD